MPYEILDEYEADFLNEDPPRREEIAEIQDREEADLLCYANPNHAQSIIKAVNSYNKIQTLLYKWENEFQEIHDKGFDPEISDTLAEGYFKQARQLEKCIEEVKAIINEKTID